MNNRAFTDATGCSDGENSIGWGQLQLLHDTSQRLRSPQSPPEPLPTPVRSLQHPSERYGYEPPDHQRPITPTGTEVQHKYQRMLAVVEER